MPILKTKALVPEKIYIFMISPGAVAFDSKIGRNVKKSWQVGNPRVGVCLDWPASPFESDNSL